MVALSRGIAAKLNEDSSMGTLALEEIYFNGWDVHDVNVLIGRTEPCTMFMANMPCWRLTLSSNVLQLIVYTVQSIVCFSELRQLYLWGRSGDDGRQRVESDTCGYVTWNRRPACHRLVVGRP